MDVCVLDCGFYLFAIPVEQMPYRPAAAEVCSWRDWQLRLKLYRRHATVSAECAGA